MAQRPARDGGRRGERRQDSRHAASFLTCRSRVSPPPGPGLPDARMVQASLRAPGPLRRP